MKILMIASLIILFSLVSYSLQDKKFITSFTFGNKQVYFDETIKVNQGNNYFYINVNKQAQEENNSIPGILYITNSLADVSKIKYFISSSCNSVCTNYVEQPDKDKNCWPKNPLLVSQSSVIAAKQTMANIECQISININSGETTEQSFRILEYPIYRIEPNYSGSTLFSYDIPIFWGQYKNMRFFNFKIVNPVNDKSHVKDIKITYTFDQKDALTNFYIGTDDSKDECKTNFPSSKLNCATKKAISDPQVSYTFTKLYNSNMQNFNIYGGAELITIGGQQSMNLKLTLFYEITCDKNYNFDSIKKICSTNTGQIPTTPITGPHSSIQQLKYDLIVTPKASQTNYFYMNPQIQKNQDKSLTPGVLYIIDENNMLDQLIYSISSSCATKCPAYTEKPAKLTNCWPLHNPDFNSSEVIMFKQDVENINCNIAINFDLTDKTTSQRYRILYLPLIITTSQLQLEEFWLTSPIYWSQFSIPLYFKIIYPFTSTKNMKNIKSTFTYKKTQKLQGLFVGSTSNSDMCTKIFPDEDQVNCFITDNTETDTAYVYTFTNIPSGDPLTMYIAIQVNQKVGAASNEATFNFVYTLNCEDGYEYVNDSAQKISECKLKDKICPSGQFYDKEIFDCHPCMDHCSVCNSITTCTTCASGYKYEKAQCTQFSNILLSISFLIYILIFILF